MASTVIIGQDQKTADSLIQVYQTGLGQFNELAILKEIAFNERNPDKKLHYAELLISKAKIDSSYDFLHSGYLQKGYAQLFKSNLDHALESFFKSIEYAQRTQYIRGTAAAMISVADVYSQMGNSRNAVHYYNQGIQTLRQTNDSVSLATALLNAGDEYFNSKEYDSAILYFTESGSIYRKVNYPIGTAYNLGNLGMVYAAQGSDGAAEANINEAIAILEETKDYSPIAVYLTYMSDIYKRKNDFAKALTYAQRSLTLARQYQLKSQISDAYFKLYELYEGAGDHKISLDHYRNHIIYRDSVKNVEAVQQMADLRTNFEVSQKQVEVDLLNQQKKNQQIIVLAIAGALLLSSLLALGLYRRNRFINRTKKIIEEERNKSDALLLNILPEETAKELKDRGEVKAKKFESVTVLFTDFKDFTTSAERLEPEQLVKSIDYYFRAFDQIITRYGLEKIKTIGDAYMCAGGIPVESNTHARDVVRAARDMAAWVEERFKKEDQSLVRFEMRIGINTGPVVAGIVGTKKWQYDIWGDTVNVASRMETESEPGRINISESTYDLIKEEFTCEYRGELMTKNRGSLKMYFLCD
ncbi:MAG: tetratricopeptide repeat protein [Cyclobacteriaceae bacterium]|nr:tetratricopeptide repeat protein [Cyclobacteriaceae bacterium]